MSALGTPRQRWLHPWKSADLDRLACEIRDFEAKLYATPEETRNNLWLEASRACLSSAREELGRGSADTGWSLLHAARRWEAFWATPERCLAWACELRNETAKKLTGSWRQRAAEELLKPSPEGSIAAPSLYLAAQMRDEAARNEFRAASLISRHVTLLVVGLIGILSGIGLYAWWSPLPLGEIDGLQAGGIGILVPVMLFGGLGGALSAIIPLPGKWRGLRHPERLMDVPITFVRPLLGAAAALGIFAVTRAGVFSFGDGSARAVLALAFVSGFSEKFFISAIGKAAPPEVEKRREGALPTDREPFTPNAGVLPS
jgi:hypothetical protein